MNRGCVTCRLGRPQPLWGLSLAPASCCYAESHRATKEECTRYRLAGDSPWWICATCKRPHIFKPNMKAMV